MIEKNVRSGCKFLYTAAIGDARTVPTNNYFVRKSSLKIKWELLKDIIGKEGRS
jgi:hypothetical protein